MADRRRDLRPWQVAGLVVVAVVLAVLLLGAESWPMRVALLSLGAVGALAAIDLPFPQYHLLGVLSVAVFAVATASYATVGFGDSVVTFVVVGVATGTTYLLVYRQQAHAL